MAQSFVNITGYRFVDIVDCAGLKTIIQDRCIQLDLKGLILIAPEGFNYFLAGNEEATTSFRQDIIHLGDRIRF